MKKKLVKILTIAICIVSIFTVNASAWTAEQPEQGYLPFVMTDQGTVLWAMLPYGTFAIDASTYPEGYTYEMIDNLIIGQMSTVYIIWSYTPTGGEFEGIPQFYGEYYTSDEPTGFIITTYDFTVDDNEIQINFGIFEPSTSQWLYDPTEYTPDIQTDANNSYIPVAFFTNNTVNAEIPYNRELSYWALSHYPIANTFWEEQDSPLYNIGYRDGQRNADKKQFDEGKKAGYNEAKLTEFNRGYQKALQESEKATFAALIFAVIDTPISVLTNMLDFNILGTNMSSFVYQMVSALFFLVIVKVILKVLI